MVKQNLQVPVLAIDGGAGTGKGTIRTMLARHLGFHSLDSGVLYRALGLICNRKDLTSLSAMVDEALTLDVRVEGEEVFLDGLDCTTIIRSDEAGKLASQVAAISEVREALREFQLRQRRTPGLVADGRDQGFIFETPFRYFFTTTPEERAGRRVQQYERLGIEATYDAVLEEILRRDKVDKERTVQPLRPHPEAVVVDTTNMLIQDVFRFVLEDFHVRHNQ